MRPLTLLLATVVLAAILVPVLLRGHTEALYANGGGYTALSWPSATPITYRFNNQVGPALGNLTAGSDPVTAINSAFSTLGAATGLTFVNGGTTAITDVGTDGTNLVTFAGTATNLAAVGGALAVTVFTYNTSSFRINEADIVFNATQSFTTTGVTSAQDIQSVAVHEVGHFVGQKHSPLLHASMFPFNGAGSTAQRSLSEDDRAGLRTIYPQGTATSYGTVTGTVRRTTGQAVFGAHLVLRDAATSRATTGGASFADGSFSIGSVPPGVYYVYAEPLDGPFPAGSLSGGIWSPGSFDTTFRTSFLGGTANPTPVVVRAGTTTNIGQLTVDATAPTLNITGAATSNQPLSFSNFTGLTQAVTSPSSLWLVIGGPGLNTRPDSAFSVVSPFVSITGPSTFSGTFSGSNVGYKVFPIAVQAQAAPGGYDLRVVDAATGEVAFMAGGLDVTTPGNPAWTAPFLASCGGSAGAVALSGVGLPTIGNAAFSLQMTNTVGGRLGYFLLSARPDALTLYPGCRLAVDLATLLFPFPGVAFPTTNGVTTLAAPIPNQPSIANNDVFVQMIIADPTSAFGVAVTNGLVVHLN